MDQKYFEEIKAREQAATPGPWHTEKVYHDEPGYEEFIKSARVNTEPDEDHSASTITMNNWSNPAMYDLKFIAHARTDIPALLAEVERLTAENKEKISRRYQAECNYDHAVKDRDDLQAQIDMYGGDEGITAVIQERDTLKKQIGLMAKYIVEQGNVDMNLCDDIPNELHLKYQPQNDGNYPNEPCIQCVQEHFKHQAEQRPDEVTHGEAEKK